MAKIYYKKPTEYAFHIWIKNYPESTHPADTERFMQFAQTVCRFNSRNWKDVEYLESQILKFKPNFDTDRLQKILIAFENVLAFYKTAPLTSDYANDERELPYGQYYERSVDKDGNFVEVVKTNSNL